MKESVLDILIYLFENYFDAELELAPEPDRDTGSAGHSHAGSARTASVEQWGYAARAAQADPQVRRVLQASGEQLIERWSVGDDQGDRFRNVVSA